MGHNLDFLAKVLDLRGSIDISIVDKCETKAILLRRGRSLSHPFCTSIRVPIIPLV